MMPIAPLAGSAPALAPAAARTAPGDGAADFAAHLAQSGGAEARPAPEAADADMGAEGGATPEDGQPDAAAPGGLAATPLAGPPIPAPQRGHAGAQEGSGADAAEAGGEAAADPFPRARPAAAAKLPLPDDAGDPAGPAAEIMGLPERAEDVGRAEARMPSQRRAEPVPPEGVPFDRAAAFPADRQMAGGAAGGAPPAIAGEPMAFPEGVSGSPSGAYARTVLPPSLSPSGQSGAAEAKPVPEAGPQAAADVERPGALRNGALPTGREAALAGEGAASSTAGRGQADEVRPATAGRAASAHGLASVTGAAGFSEQMPGAAGARVVAAIGAGHAHGQVAKGAPPARFRAGPEDLASASADDARLVAPTIAGHPRPGTLAARVAPATADAWTDKPPCAATDAQPLSPASPPAATAQAEPPHPALAQGPLPEVALRSPAGTPAPDHGGAGAARQVAQAVVEYRGGEARLVLDPEELGPLRLTVSHQDGGTLIQIVAERPDTAELMRRHADLLLQDLADSGVAQARLSFASGGETGAGREGRSPPAPPGAPAGDHARPAADPAPAARPTPGARTLDMRV